MIYDLEPLANQDKLEERLLKTTKGSYLSVTGSVYHIDENMQFPSFTQDKLDQGLIRFPNGSYHSFSSLRIEESECFIATAVYGDINAPQLQALRRFRDEVLGQDPIGRAFISFYYSGAGEATAKILRERIPAAIPFIRKGLNRLVEVYPKD